MFFYSFLSFWFSSSPVVSTTTFFFLIYFVHPTRFFNHVGFIIAAFNADSTAVYFFCFSFVFKFLHQRWSFDNRSFKLILLILFTILILLLLNRNSIYSNLATTRSRFNVVRSNIRCVAWRRNDLEMTLWTSASIWEMFLAR